MSERKLRDELYCSKCGDWVKYKAIERREIFRVRGENIEIPVEVAVCAVCGEDLFEPTLEGENLRRAYRIYAEKHGLVTPGEIRRIREKYEVSQAVFAKILGVGKATIERYEAGALPTESISNLIRSAESLKSFEELLEKNRENISVSDYQRIKRRIEEYKTKEKTGESAAEGESFSKLGKLESLFAASNGGKIDFPKLYGVVAFILRALGGCVSKVRFVKLLWFIDEAYCEKHGKPLTGLVYAHLPMGPSPNRHDSLLDVLEESGTVEIQREEIEEAEVIRIILKDESMTKYLDEKDLKVVQEVMEKYGSCRTRDLINLSHQDERWLNTRDGELIEL